MTLGFLGKEDLRQLTGAARQADQVAWLRLAYISYSDHDRKPEARDADWFDKLLILPTVEVIPAGKRPPGSGCGVYMLFSRDGGLNYIGQSVNVGGRVIEHMKRKGHSRQRQPFASYGYVEVHPVLLQAVEITHIHALAPPENGYPDCCVEGGFR